ncbi:MAG: hypothetical protein U9R69_02675 [Thermodesulfobacteriota bacterium]|nr:hypothetical protein [Thermodesulfobacteriota bacterium]
MTKTNSVHEFAPYVAVFPKSRKGMAELELQNKRGKAKPGVYLFVETYCVMENCDCRQVILEVINEKQRTVAVIDFPLDIDHPFINSCLNDSVKQSAAAAVFLDIFVESVAEMPDWYRGMCQRYRAVRKKIDQTPYRGERFPSKKYLQYLQVQSPLEDPDGFYEELQHLFSVEVDKYSKREPADDRQGQMFGEGELLDDGHIVALAKGYQGREDDQYHGSAFEEKHLRLLLQKDQSADELSVHLVELYRSGDDQGLDAALLLLGEVMDILRTDLERRRPPADVKMEVWQTALAHHVFNPDVDPGLGAEITRVLLSARIDILPQLHQANATRMFEMVPPEGYPDVTPELAIEDLLAEMANMGVNSPFEMVDALLQMMAIGHTEAQLTMYEQMFYSKSILAREAAVLMVFHPHEEVREQVADFLAGAEGEFFTPVMLRRLIVSRNWFPDALRKKLDQMIAHARRARVNCAPLNKPVKVQVYATTVDGANAQSLQMVVPCKRGYRSCSTMPKKGFGMADAFLLELENKKRLKEFLDILQFDVGGIEVNINYLDERVCQVLADGSSNGKVPNHWLVGIAEELGRDQWKAIPFHVESELESLKIELQKQGMISAKSAEKALRNSSDWSKEQFIAGSWFEDDNEVDEKLNRLFREEDYADPYEPIEVIVNEVLEPRRDEWLERLVLTTTWLKAAKKPPIPWGQMYHVAAAVAADGPLAEVPLMWTIAEHTVGAYLERLDDSPVLNS